MPTDNGTHRCYTRATSGEGNSTHTLQLLVVTAALSAAVQFGIAQDSGPRLTTIHSFKGGKTGATPYAPVVIGAAGILYGTTEQGGTLTYPCQVSPPTGGC